MGKTKKYSLILFLFVFSFLISFELILQINDFSFNIPFFEEDIPFINRKNVRDSGLQQFDLWLFWKNRPNFNKEEWGIKINSLGFRDYEFSVKKNNRFRIIVLGDSCTAGHAISLEETYCKQLEKLLNKDRFGKRYEVINGGVPGYSSFQGLRYFEIISKKYNPDLVIIFFGANDRSYARFADKDLSPWMLLKLSLMRNMFSKLKTTQFLIKKFYNLDNIKWHTRVSPEDYKANLVAIKEGGKKNKTKTLFIKPCLRYEILQGSPDNNYAPTQPYIDFFDSFKYYKDSPGEIFIDHKHFTCFGNKIIATEIYKWILSHGLLVKDN